MNVNYLTGLKYPIVYIMNVNTTHNHLLDMNEFDSYIVYYLYYKQFATIAAIYFSINYKQSITS